MGIIQRQSIKSTFVNYVGVAIGAVSVLFIYPLHKELYGYLQFLFSTAIFLLPLATLGTLSLIIRFFPIFKDQKNRNHGFLMLILILLCGSFFLFLIVLLLFKESFFQILSTTGIDPEGRIRENAHYIVVILFFICLKLLFTFQAANYKRIVIPDMANTLGLKLWLPILVLMFYFGYIDEMQAAWMFTFYFFLFALLLAIYLQSLGALSFTWPDWSKLTPALRKEMGKYAFFGSLSSIGSMIAFRIDSIMISTMIGFSSNGLYFIMLFLANVLEIPLKAVGQISSPIISESWAKNDREEIKNIYRKSSINLMISGIPIFLMIWFSLNALDAISTDADTFNTGKYIFLFIAIGKLANLTAGINSQILYYSDKYHYSLYFLLFLGVSNFILNIYLIRLYGVNGAALASMISLIAFNIIYFLFIQKTYKMHPFSRQTLKVFGIGLISFAALYWIPDFHSPYLTLGKNAVLIGLIYFPAIYFSNVSVDLNQMINREIVRLRSIF